MVLARRRRSAGVSGSVVERVVSRAWRVAAAWRERHRRERLRSDSRWVRRVVSAAAARRAWSGSVAAAAGRLKLWARRAVRSGCMVGSRVVSL
jgi:hypothetical protein